MTEESARAEDETGAAAPGGEQQPPHGPAATEAESDPATVAAEFKDRLLRTLAEMENLRKRTEREVADSGLRAVTGFARDMLGVADNMQRALEAVAPQARQSGDPALKSLIEGVELTERELMKALERNGVRLFNPQGLKFDPHVHQAIFEVPDASVPAGHVVQVVQPGYMIGERVLRPAMVGVSKGGPRAAPSRGNGESAASGSHSGSQESAGPQES